MELSNSLLKAFAEATSAEPESNVNTTTNLQGIAVVDGGAKFVKIDGSDVLTPVSIGAEFQNGDRVMVSIENHTATVTNNLSKPSLATTAVTADGSTYKLSALYGDFNTLNADFAEVKVLTGQSITYENGEIKDLKGNTLYYLEGTIDDLKGKTITYENGEIKDLKGDTLYYLEGTIDDLKGKTITYDKGEIKDLEGRTLYYLEGTIDDLKGKTITYDEGEIKDLKGNTLYYLEGTIENLKSTKAEVEYLDANFAHLVNGFIDTALIADGSIVDAKILGVSANKLTAGTIDASKITVTNLNADNLTVGTINGKLIGKESITLDSLAEEVPTKEYLDELEEKLQSQIDGAIETWTSDTIPTLHNYPAINWTSDAIRKTHVGDVLYVVNAGNEADGFCYRFVEDQNGTFYWTLVRDSEITKVLGELAEVQGNVDGLKSFQETASSWISDTNGELESLKTRTTTIETEYITKSEAKSYADGVGKELYTEVNKKVDSTVFNEIKNTVDENSSTITKLTTTTTTLREDLDGLQIGGRNLILKSDTEITSNNWHIQDEDWDLSEEWINGETYTLSIYGSNLVPFYIWRDAQFTPKKLYVEEVLVSEIETRTVNEINEAGLNIQNTSGTYAGLTSGNRTFQTITFVCSGATFNLKRLAIYKRDANNVTNVTISKIKLEKGNKVTDWTAAPEDMERVISEVSSTVHEVKKTADSSIDKIGKLTETVDGNKKDIENRVTLIEADLSGYKSTVSLTYQTISNMSAYSTKKDAQDYAESAKSSAIEAAAGDATSKSENARIAAIADTDNKLKNYSTTIQMNSSIEQKANAISLSVVQSEISKYEDTLSKTEIVITDSAISSIVNGVNKGNAIASLINQTGTTVQIDAERINLNGYLTISNADTRFDAAGTAKDYTDSITNNIYVPGTTKIDGGKIYANSIEGSAIAANSITTSKLNVGIGGNNLVTNGAPYSTDGWSEIGGRILLVDCDEAPAGKALRYENTWRLQQFIGITRPVSETNIREGEIYTISCWVRASRNINANLSYDRMQDSQGIVAQVNRNTVHLTTEWTYVSFTAPMTFKFSMQGIVGLRLSVDAATQGGHNFWMEVHSVMLEHGDLIGGIYTPATNELSGFTIGHSSIQNGMISFEDTAHSGVYLGIDGIALGGGSFSVSAGGYLVANNAFIRGRMESNVFKTQSAITQNEPEQNYNGKTFNQEGQETSLSINGGEIIFNKVSYNAYGNQVLKKHGSISVEAPNSHLGDYYYNIQYGITFRDGNGNRVLCIGTGNTYCYENILPVINQGQSLGSQSLSFNRVWASNYQTVSDRRAKLLYNRIKRSDTIELLSAQIWEYSYTNDKDSQHHYGVIAQDVRDIMKNIGLKSILSINDKDPNKNYFDLSVPDETVVYAIDYTKFVPVLIDGWQYHDGQINNLVSEIQTYSSKWYQHEMMLQDAYNKIAQLEKRIKELKESA